MRQLDVNSTSGDPFTLTENDFRKALSEINTVMDIRIEDILRLYQMACGYAHLRHVEHVPIREYMTQNVITIDPEKSLAEAARLFLVHGISGLPVVDKLSKIKGMLTEADLLSAIGLSCKRPACSLWYKLEHLFRHEDHIRSLLGRVGDLMYKHPIYIHQDKSLHDAIEVMKKWHIKKLIVTDEQVCVSGIITRSNIIQAMLERGMLGSVSSTVPA